MIATGEELIGRLRDSWPDLLCDASVGTAAGRMRLSNSNGVDFSYAQTSYYAFLGGQLIRGTDILNIWAGHNSSKWFGADEIDRINCRPNSVNSTTRKNSPRAPGRRPVVFTSRGVAAALLGPLLSGFNGKNIATGLIPACRPRRREGIRRSDNRLRRPHHPIRKRQQAVRRRGPSQQAFDAHRKRHSGGGIFDCRLPARPVRRARRRPTGAWLPRPHRAGP